MSASASTASRRCAGIPLSPWLRELWGLGGQKAEGPCRDREPSSATPRIRALGYSALSIAAAMSIVPDLVRISHVYVKASGPDALRLKSRGELPVSFLNTLENPKASW